MSANLVQYYRNGDGWELASLDEDEVSAVHSAVRERNKEIFQECVVDAMAILAEYQCPIDFRNVSDIAQQLFERRALHIAVILDGALRRKVFELRRNGAHAEG